MKEQTNIPKFVSVVAIGFAAIKINSTAYAPSQAAWGGAKPMLVYLLISAVTFIAGGWMTWKTR